MNKFFEDYCSETTIHVLHYVTQRNRPLLERIFWSLLCLVASGLLVYQIVSDWNTVTSGPVQVIVTSPRFELTKIDFPAVTICPVNKIRRLKLEKVTVRNLRKIDAATAERYKRTIVALSLLSFPTFDHPLKYLFYTNTTPYPIINSMIPQLMHEVTPTIDEMIARCYWRGNRYNCTDLFRIQRTEQGFCFSFNSKTAERHNTSFKNPPYLEPDGSLTPLRSNSAGKITGLELFLMQPHDEYKTEGIANVGTSTGYLFMIHNPLQYPSVLHNFLVTESSKKIARFQISVAATFEDPSLKRLDDDARGCRLESIKRFLRANDTQTNCYQLCRFAWIQRLCGCVPYYYFLPDEKSEYCGIHHLECLAKHKVFLQAQKFAKEQSEQDMVSAMECSCHPMCSYVAYTTEFYFNWRECDIHDYQYYAYVDVFYKKNWAIGYSRLAKYSIKDFLVGIGGVGGLYLGASLISCVEIVYILIKFIRFLLSRSQRRHFHIVKKKASVVLPFVN